MDTSEPAERQPEEARYACDLHCHTVRSDGADTPQELIDHAAELGMHAIAITDHDIDPPRTMLLADGREVDPLEYAAERGVRLVPGYEFSTNTWVDDVHICGYWLDWSHPDLQAEVAAAARSKSQAYEELCHRLTEMGMEVDWAEDILQYVDPHGRIQRRQPDEVQRKHIFEAMAAKGYAKTWSEAKLMVREDPDLNVPRRKIEPEAAIELIRRCGGIAVLAHPHLIDETVTMPGRQPVNRDAYIESLIDAGLHGLEVRYTYDKTTYKGTKTPEEIEKELRVHFAGRVGFFSGGSDYHAGHKKGTRKVRYLGERGLTVAEFQDTPLARRIGS